MKRLRGFSGAVRPRKALGQRTGGMSVGDDNSGSPPLMNDPEIQLRTFVEALFDRPPPSDDDLMRTVLSLKDKSSRLLLSNLFLKRYREASTFPFDVSSSTFEYLVDMCNAVLRTALNEADLKVPEML